MVGAGDLVVPLLGLPYWLGVMIVGSIVIFIVATAGMTSTTYVQFLKGGLLVVSSVVLTFYILQNGLSLTPNDQYHQFKQIDAIPSSDSIVSVSDPTYKVKTTSIVDKLVFVKLEKEGSELWYRLNRNGDQSTLEEMLNITTKTTGELLYNGAPKSEKKFYQVGHLSKIVVDGVEVDHTGPVGPFEFIKIIGNSEIVRFTKKSFTDGDDKVTVWYQNVTKGKDVMKPGLLYKISKAAGATIWDKLNFLSLMLALFLGTSALPHILIRYYTVSSPRAARKSTIVAISAIGFFYVLTLFMGLGAMINGALDVESSNMSAPLLAKTFGVGIFSIISAVAFATVLGTVSGLIVASSGAIAHDFIDKYLQVRMNDKAKVKTGKIAAIGVGIFAIALGILFKGMNVSFLVGLAFAVAASANLPSILFLLFWKKTTAKGISSSIIVGIMSSIGIILLSPTMYGRYGLSPSDALIPLDNPGIISIPLAVITLVIVSLMTQKDNSTKDYSRK